MKRILLASVAAVILLGVAGLIYLGKSGHPSPKNGHWLRIFAATRAYQEQLTKAGQPIPETVSPQDLIDRKLLSATDAAGLESVKIRLFARPKPGDMTAVLMEVTLSDGTRLAAFADGSAGALPNNAR